eukprot:gene7270-11588_t
MSDFLKEKLQFQKPKDNRYYGPPKLLTNDEDMVIREPEKLAYSSGDSSYNEILYSYYTPCGPMYSIIKELRSNKSTNEEIENGTNFEKQSEDISQESKIYKNFQSCTRIYQTFYLGRKRNLDKLMYEQEEKKI